jgi:hypothetical protein
MKTNTKEQKVPKWFNGEVYTEGALCTNPFSRESIKLNAIELSIYDMVMGATMWTERMNPHTDSYNEAVKDLRKGLDWFRRHNAEAYMVLLD